MLPKNGSEIFVEKLLSVGTLSIITQFKTKMEKKQQVIPKDERLLFVVCPTLDMMLSSCDNVKQMALECGIDYSNFVKSCKLQKDIRISTYQKHAKAFGMDTLIVHLPLGMIESYTAVHTHISNRCYTIQKEDLLRILYHYYPLEIDDSLYCLELFIERLLKESKREFLKKLIPSIADIFQTLAESYGDK